MSSAITGAPRRRWWRPLPPQRCAATPTAVGHILPFVSVAITDPDGGLLPVGAEGLLRVRSPMLASFYHDDPAATAQAFRDGWFLTGDVASIRAEDGMLAIAGRGDARINRGGHKFLPEPLEAWLSAQGGVRDAGVASFATRDGDNRVIALIVPEACAPKGELCLATLHDTLRARAPLDAPDDLLLAPAIPRTANQKIARPALRDLARALYAQG